MLKEILKYGPKDGRLSKDGDGNVPIFATVDSGNLLMTHELLFQNITEQINAVKVRCRFGRGKAYHLKT